MLGHRLTTACHQKNKKFLNSAGVLIKDDAFERSFDFLNFKSSKLEADYDKSVWLKRCSITADLSDLWIFSNQPLDDCFDLLFNCQFGCDLLAVQIAIAICYSRLLADRTF